MPETYGCDEVREALFALVDCEECEERRAILDEDGTAGPGAHERVLLLAHATGCAHCTDLLEAERHLRVVMRTCFDEAVPADLEDRIARALAASRAAPTDE